MGRAVTAELGYHPPFDWAGMLQFLGRRASRDVEWIQPSAYLRTVRLADHRGWILVRPVPERATLLIELTESLAPVLPGLLDRLGHLFDLSARPEVIAAHLSRDPLLADAVARNPGLRVPGAFDGFELAVRAVLGQQITVSGATTLAGRLAEAFGEAVVTPHPALSRLFPSPERVAAAPEAQIAALGIVRSRARTILVLADEFASGRLTLEPGGPPEIMIERLVALPGIGAWTAQYIAMRALRWSDAFPKEDVALRKRLGGVSARRAAELSEAWRPWRSYATMQLWKSSSSSSPSS